MNFSKMSGYEFEDFIANLLRQKGFKVTQTDYSNDGGVDLIAEYFKPLFSGKYIVQCKNYTNNLVGQPELRDLYGVVMSEKANKGILITTSDFTTQAKNFAKDKNLELINGSVLNSLIEGVDIKVEEPQLKFYEMPEFDKNTYDFLKKRLKAGKKNEKNYDNLITLLESYILNGKVDICKAGLIDEARYLIEQKSINTNKDYVYDPSNKNIDLDKLDLYFIEGNLAKVTEELLKSNDFYFSEYPSFLSFYDAAFNLFPFEEAEDRSALNKKFLDIFGFILNQNSWAKNISKPSFLELAGNLKESIKYMYCGYNSNFDYFVDINQENKDIIINIIYRDFSKLYSEEELKEIIGRYKYDYKFNELVENWNVNDFDKFEDNVFEAKSLFIKKLKEISLVEIRFVGDYKDRFINNLFSKFLPDNIREKITKFSRLSYNRSPLFDYPLTLMLYLAYKQIGFEKGCVEITKNIIIPKSIDDFSFDFIPEITKILCPNFYKNYREYIELEIKSYNEFLNGAFDNIINPIWHDKYYKKSDQEIISEIKEVFKRHNIDVD